MGPVRHQQLIRLLALVAALDLTAGVVTLSTRVGPASAANPAGRNSGASAGSNGQTDAGGTGILADGRFSHRRGSGGTVAGRSTTSGSSESAAPPPTSSSQPPATAASPASGASTATARGLAAPTGSPSTTSPARPTPSSGAPPTSAATRPAAPSTSAPATTGTTAARGTTSSTTGSRPTGGPSPGSAPPAGAANQAVTVDDPAGDTAVDGTQKPKAESRADLVRSQAAYQAQAVVLTAQVAQPGDPRQDPHWASDATFIDWQIDTNGDGAPDVEVDYYVAAGKLGADVNRANDPNGAALCAAQAGYSADGYTVAFDPACFGRPASFSYRVTIYYDTNPKDDNADVITDTAPNGGLSRPLARPAG